MPHALEMDARHRYWCTCGADDCKGRVFDSVTTILSGAVPKNLTWWGMMHGLDGARKLARDGYDIGAMGAQELLGLMKEHQLTTKDLLIAGGVRGTVVHGGLEAYARDGVLPMPLNFPAEYRGYVRGLARFVLDYKPVFVNVERRVLSVVHGFAGTYDFTARVEAELVTTLKKGGRIPRLVLAPKAGASLLVRGDLKTSKWVYPASHFAQLEAYEGADVEMGSEPSDCRAVLHVNAAGGMEFVPATARDEGQPVRLSRFEDFLALKASADAIRAMDSSYTRPKVKA